MPRSLTTRCGALYEGHAFVGNRVYSGDRTEIDRNCVINPGALLGRDSFLDPMGQWRGVLPEKTVVKMRQEQQLARRRATA